MFDRLKNAIIEGSLEPGRLLVENRLADELGVSRTPIREALRKLANESLVTFLPGRKMVVSVPTQEDIRNIYEIREIVECGALMRIRCSEEAVLEGIEDCTRRARRQLELGEAKEALRR